MADRVYPSSKSNVGNAANGTAPSFPSTKAQMYGANRAAYRPQPPPKRSRSRRGCCCSLCLFLTLFLLGLILLCAIAGGIFYLLYHPHRPTFTASSLRLSTFTVSTSGKLSSRLDLSVTARNPNRKMVFLFDPATVSVTSDGIDIGNGQFPAVVLEAKNTTVMKTTVSTSGLTLDSTAVADLKGKRNLPLDIEFETKAGVKIGGLKTSKVRIKVACSGISVAVPKAKAKAKANVTASSPDVSCKAKLHIKIWKWTI